MNNQANARTLASPEPGEDKGIEPKTPVKIDLEVPGAPGDYFAEVARLATLLSHRFISASDSAPPRDLKNLAIQALRGMTRSLNDKYTAYLEPRQYQTYCETREGRQFGIGLDVDCDEDNQVIVMATIHPGPCDGLDIVPGDVLLDVDGEEVVGQTKAQADQILRGEIGSKVTLTLKGADGSTRVIEVVRAEVTLKYVYGRVIENNLGFIRISRFGANSHEHFEAVLKGLMAENVSGIIIDLRDNTGGSTAAMRHIFSLIAPEEIIYRVRHNGKKLNEFGRLCVAISDLPLCIVVNHGSMSASENLAGALQDYGRATIVGETTYGKGMVQRTYALDETLGGAVRMTVGLNVTPLGHVVQGVGITPDVEVKDEFQRFFTGIGAQNTSDEARLFKIDFNRRQFLVKEGQANKEAVLHAQDLALLAAIDTFE